MIYLSTKEFAAAKKCSEQYIRKAAKDGKIKAEKLPNDKGRVCYKIPITELPANLQNKYYKQIGIETPPSPPKKKAVSNNRKMDDFTAEQRQEISMWIDIVKQWDEYCFNSESSKAVATVEFVEKCKTKYEDINISSDILYRKKRAVKDNNLSGLCDQRGQWKKGTSSIPNELWNTFLYYYLDEAQHPMQKCYEYTKMVAEKEYPHLLPLQNYTTYYRHVQSDISEAVETLGRYGEKAFRDRCAPYIKRVYDGMRSNEWWIADNHTFDVITKGANGKTHRLYLTAFFDARSGIFTGCFVTDAPSSQATLIALRKGILKYGIPENIYVDNGREFLTFDIGGLGHRKKKSQTGRFEPPPVFERLGIKMTNAIVRNAKAKIIERRFRDVKDHLSRLFETYTGGNVVERPEKLKSVIKNGDIPTDTDFTEKVEQLLEWYFNEQPCSGAVASDKGKTRMQVYTEQLTSKRVAEESDLNLMLMRSSRAQKVTRRGVHLAIGGQKLDYFNDELLLNHLGEQVYFRYDPDDISSVRIYDLSDKYIMTVPIDNTAVLRYGSSKEDVKEAIGKVRRMERITRQALKDSTYTSLPRHTALELVLGQAEYNRLTIKHTENTKVVELQHANETQAELQEAVGSQTVTINKSKMIQNIESRKED